MHILYATDRGIDRYTVHALREIGHVVQTQADMADALEGAARQEHDLVLLDLAGPDPVVAGRFASAAPAALLVLLSAVHDAAAAAATLRAGADAVLPRPLQTQELQERIRALMRLGERRHEDGGLEARLAAIRAERALQVNGARLPLSPREVQILLYLMRRPGEVVSPERLGQNVWGEAGEPSPERTRAAVARLRRRLQGAFGRTFIETVKGHGYAFRDEDPGASSGSMKKSS